MPTGCDQRPDQFSQGAPPGGGLYPLKPVHDAAGADSKELELPVKVKRTAKCHWRFHNDILDRNQQQN